MSPQNKILLRNFDFKSSYEDWLLQTKNRDLSVLRSIFEDYLIANQHTYALHEKGQGFEAFLWKNPEHINLSFVMDFWRIKIIKLGYYNYLSDEKQEHYDGGNKMLFERHFLKPLSGIKMNDNTEPSFGNITIEVCLKGKNDSIFLKLSVTKYPNTNYHSFEKLLGILMTSD